MNKRLMFFALFSFVGLSGIGLHRAVAGTKTSNPVLITSNNGITKVQGSLGSARASADGAQYLACTVYVTAVSRRMSCAGRDAAGTSVSCVSTAGNLIDVVAAIGQSSYLTFMRNDSSSECTEVNVANGSYFRPVTN